jgi:Spy/CpxP family protein refolding chaperone
MKSPRLLGLPGITAASLLLMLVALASSPLAAQDSRSNMKNFQHGLCHHDGEHGL